MLCMIYVYYYMYVYYYLKYVRTHSVNFMYYYYKLNCSVYKHITRTDNDPAESEHNTKR